MQRCLLYTKLLLLLVFDYSIAFLYTQEIFISLSVCKDDSFILNYSFLWSLVNPLHYYISKKSILLSTCKDGSSPIQHHRGLLESEVSQQSAGPGPVSFGEINEEWKDRGSQVRLRSPRYRSILGTRSTTPEPSKHVISPKQWECFQNHTWSTRAPAPNGPGLVRG